MTIVMFMFLAACGSVCERPHSMRPLISTPAQKALDLAPMAHILFCIGHEFNCKAVGSTTTVPLKAKKRAELQSVNTQVNRAIKPADRPEGRHAIERWNINPSHGDCNDYAVTKQDALLKKGWPISSLLLAEVILKQTGQHHIVLIAKTTAGDFVLDNLSRDVQPVAEAKAAFQWYRIQSAKDPKLWKAVAQEG